MNEADEAEESPGADEMGSSADGQPQHAHDPAADTLLQGDRPRPPSESDTRTATRASASNSGTNETQFATIDELTESISERDKGKRRYHLLGEIGRGGMGLVLRCTDRDLRRPVAMKVLKRKRGGEETRRFLRFVQEAQITGQLEHPNIVPIHEFGTDDQGRPFFTMKLVDGQSLKELLTDLKEGLPRACRTYDQSRLLEVFTKICDGIAFAHSRGVIHRDLKPANIMLGNFGEVLVMDWGLARLQDERPPSDEPESESGDRLGSLIEDIDIELTMEGQAAGTPAYMPPEQARGDLQRLDQRTDIFALGAILYEMLTLRPPYLRTDTKTRTLDLAKGGRWTPLPLTVPAELRAIVAKALAFAPEGRYQTVGEMAGDVRRFRSGHSVSVKWDSLWERFTKLMARHQALSVAIATATFLILLVGTLFWLRLDHKQDELEREAVARVQAIEQTEQLREDIEAHRTRRWNRDIWVARPSATGADLHPWLLYGDPDKPARAVAEAHSWRLELPATVSPGYAALVVGESVDPAISVRTIRGDLRLQLEAAFRPGRDGCCGVFLAARAPDADAGQPPERWLYTGYAAELRHDLVTLWRWGLPVASAPRPAAVTNRAIRLGLERSGDRLRVLSGERTILEWTDLHPLAGRDQDACGVYACGGRLLVRSCAIDKLAWAPWDGPLAFAAAMAERGDYGTAREELLVIARSTTEEALRARYLQRIGWLLLVEQRSADAAILFDGLLNGPDGPGAPGYLPATPLTGEEAARTAALSLIAHLGPVDQALPPIEAWSPATRTAWNRFLQLSRPEDVALIAAHLGRRLATDLRLGLGSDGHIDDLAQALFGRVGATDRRRLAQHLAMLWTIAATWTGDATEQVRRYRRATELDSDNGLAWRELALSYARRGDLDSALTATNRFLDFHPEDGEAWYLRARTRSHLARDQEAVLEACRSDLQRSLELSPEHGPAHRLLAELHDRLGDPTAAIEHHIAAGRLMLDVPAVVLAAVTQLRGRGEAGEATALLQAALVLDPDDPVLREALDASAPEPLPGGEGRPTAP